MTKKDFVKFASAFAKAKHENYTIDNLQEDFESIFKEANSNFDKNRFKAFIAKEVQELNKSTNGA